MAQWLVMSYTKYKQVWFLINQITAKFSSCGPLLARRNSPGWALPLWKWDQLTQPSLHPILLVIPTPTYGSKEMQVVTSLVSQHLLSWSFILQEMRHKGL